MSTATLRAAIFAALDALEAGDQQEMLAILHSALEDGESGGKGHSCEFCGCSFRWPGEHDAHLRASYGVSA